jgi:hypothetical protein
MLLLPACGFWRRQAVKRWAIVERSAVLTFVNQFLQRTLIGLQSLDSPFDVAILLLGPATNVAT